MRAFMLVTLVLLGACSAEEARWEEDEEEPARYTQATAAALPLVAACRTRAQECVKHAQEHPCQIADDACSTPSECAADGLRCISAALNY